MHKVKDSYIGTPFDLTGKIAIITGGAGLLGKEFCKALISAGAKVALVDNNKDSIKLAKVEIEKAFPKANISTYQADVINKDSVKQCVLSIQKKFDSIDILVNSAAIDSKFEKGSNTSKFSAFPNFPQKLWQESIDVNLTGTFLFTQQVCKIMEKQGRGSIINLGSNYGLVGPDQRIYKRKNHSQQAYKPVVYSVCKAGIVGFTKYLASYYSGTNIRVNVLTPSGVFNNHDQEFVRSYSNRTILRRMSDKKEFWGGVIFLASDASSYMTGANLIIDGGWTSI